MKIIITFFFALGTMLLSHAQSNIGIGTPSPNSSAILDISSTSKGLLIPRMTTAQRTAIASPANGLMVYDTDTNSLWYYSVNAWTSFSASGALSFPYTATVNTNSAAFKITNQGYGAGIEGASTIDYGVGIRGVTSGTGGWGVNASASRSDAIALYAFSDSGTVIDASNQSPANTNTLLNLTNHGMAKTASFQMVNTANTSPSVQIASNGLGNNMLLYLTNTANTGNGIELNHAGLGSGIKLNMTGPANVQSGIILQNAGIGSGITVNLTNSFNGARGLDVNQSGVGPGVFATSAGGNAVWGITSSISAAGVIGDNTFGEAVVGRNRGGNGVGAVVGRNDSSGYGVRGFNTKDGIGVLGQAGISGGTGVGGRFENVNAANGNNVLEVVGNGIGATLFVHNVNANAVNSLATFRKNNNNVARIDGTGKAFFNGGTQNSGADVAEAFDVKNGENNYEPGDVLVIATDEDRMMEKSSQSYSSLVAGVYATKPGVLLTEENIDNDLQGKIPLGVIGVIPTKVCTQGGDIKRGDMIVTSSIAGVAMKGDPALIKTGQVIGKALQDYDGSGIGLIKVLVSIK